MDIKFSPEEDLAGSYRCEETPALISRENSTSGGSGSGQAV
tara:strand:+ start:98 stop:220 length:123 start_codon:yes stop_codon:yes gene_type:complete